MNKNRSTTFIVVIGIFIVIIFGYIVFYNLMSDDESNSYYVKVNDEMSAKIESVTINNNELTIVTSGDTLEYCVKNTKSTPSENAICWHKMDDNSVTISVYSFKKYYVWIKDTEGNISNYVSVNERD